MPSDPSAAAVRRLLPVAPPLDARAIPARARRAALDALFALTCAAAYLDNPDLFHRPRVRRLVHRRHVGSLTAERLAEQLSTAAENRAAAGLLAVHSVRAERIERPDHRPCFAPDALAELHRLLVAADPNIPTQGGFRRTQTEVVWADGQRFAIEVAPGGALREQVERWYRWATLTTSPPLDAVALSMVRLLTIHPFPDANGRMARLLAQCDLVAAGLLPGLLLDLDGWTHAHRREHDAALVTAAEGRWTPWGELFAQAVTETARQRTASLVTYRQILESTIQRAADDPAAGAVLAQFRSTPAASAAWLRDRIPCDPDPPMARLLHAGILTAHPRVPGALVHPQLLAVLDAPFNSPP